MADSRSDFGWGLGGSPARNVSVHDELRYSQGAGQTDLVVDGVRNFHWLMSPAELSRPKVLLEAGINAPAEVVDCDGFRRRPLIAIRSSPWKAGSSVTPWHDEFDLDHGHIRYFGDHKPTTLGLPGSTRGNRLLLETAKLHAGTSTDERAAPRPCWCSEQLRSIGTVAQCIRGTWSSAAWRSSKPLNMWCSVTQKVAEAIRTWLLISRSSPGAMTTNSICDGLMIVVIPHWRSSRLFVTLRFRGESG